MLASKVRYGINPSISALAVIIILLTLLGAVVHEYLKRKEEKTASALAAEGLPSSGSASRSRPMRIPVGALTALVVLSLLTGLWLARGYDVEQCKVRVSEENRIHFEALKQQRLAEAKAKRDASGESASVAVEANQQGRQYQSIFDPGNLGKQVESAPEHD